MADAYQHASENYPYSITPQVRNPAPVGSLAALKCPPNQDVRFIILDGNNLSVVQGWEWKATFPLKEWFIPIDNFQIYEFTLEATGNYTEYSILNYGNIGSVIDGTIFVCLFPKYHETELNDQNDWRIHYRYSDDPTWTATGVYGDDVDTPYSTEDENTWRQMGRIMMLSGTDEYLIPPIYLQNRTGIDIPMSVMIGA